jgi:hypothetical protein
MDGAQHHIGAELAGERRIKGGAAPNGEVAHCRYGSTFSHSLDSTPAFDDDAFTDGN